MGVPNPPSRRDRKAIQFLSHLERRIMANPQIPVRSYKAAELYAQAMVIAALFSEQDRALFLKVYTAYTEGECLAEVRVACACESRDQLCLILDAIMSDEALSQTIAAYLKHTLETQTWKVIEPEIRSGRFTADNFVWWYFNPDERF